MTRAMAQRDNPDAAEAVRLATRLHGAKRGWHLAAAALGVSERTARALADGTTSGATICPIRAASARLSFRRQRAEQLRAELRALECEHGAMVAGGGPLGGSVRGGVHGGRSLGHRQGPALAAVTA